MHYFSKFFSPKSLGCVLYMKIIYHNYLCIRRTIYIDFSAQKLGVHIIHEDYIPWSFMYKTHYFSSCIRHTIFPNFLAQKLGVHIIHKDYIPWLFVYKTHYFSLCISHTIFPDFSAQKFRGAYYTQGLYIIIIYV